MIDHPALQFLVFTWGVLYLLLHAGPMLRFWYEPSIRGGTRWQFFGSECLLFSAWLLFAPPVYLSTLGQLAVAAHIATHLSYTVTDAFAHEFLMSSALATRARRPVMWALKEGGLVFDTLTHATVVTLVAVTLPPIQIAAATVLAAAGFAWVTRGYLRRYPAGGQAQVAAG